MVVVLRILVRKNLSETRERELQVSSQQGLQTDRVACVNVLKPASSRLRLTPVTTAELGRQGGRVDRQMEMAG